MDYSKNSLTLGQENVVLKQSDASLKVLKPPALRKKTAFKPFADAESTINSRSSRRLSVQAATQTEPPTPTAECGAQTDMPDSELDWLTASESPQSPDYLAKLAESRRQALADSLEENAKLAEENRQLTDLVAAMINDADAAAGAIAASASATGTDDGACPHCGGAVSVYKIW